MSTMPGRAPERRPLRNSTSEYSRPRGEEQKQHADLGDDGDEVFGDIELNKATFAQGQASNEVERYGGDTEAAGESEQVLPGRPRLHRSR